MAPSTTKQWTIEGTSGFEDLKFHDKAPVPKLGARDVLVRFHYANGIVIQAPPPHHTGIHLVTFSITGQGVRYPGFGRCGNGRGGRLRGQPVQERCISCHALQSSPHRRPLDPRDHKNRAGWDGRRHALPIRQIRRARPYSHATVVDISAGEHAELCSSHGVECSLRLA